VKRVRVLYVASTHGHIEVFHRPHLEALLASGVEAAVASGPSDAVATVTENGDSPKPFEHFPVTFARVPWSRRNLRAARQIYMLLRKEQFAVVHCHTPTASVITRLMARVAGSRAVMVYTCHGFHFYPDAPLRNWVLWFTVEWLLARLTDITVTINRWDHHAALRWLRSPRARYVPGVGVDTDRFRPAGRSVRDGMRRRLGVPEGACVVTYVAEFIPRKQHRWLLDSLVPLLAERPELHVLLVGNGPLVPVVRERVQGLQGGERVKLLGFRSDIAEILQASDIAVSTSRHEGLPMGVAEAMATGLPVVVSDDRGHRDLVTQGESGFIVRQGERHGLTLSLRTLLDDAILRARMGAQARTAVAPFALDRAIDAVRAVHDEALALYEARRGV
jgi:glycosyltransferase EpsD